MYFLYSLGGVTFNKCWITLSILNCYSTNFQGFILMKNALNNQVGLLGNMFLWLLANLKQGVIYFIKQALPPNISAGSVSTFAITSHKYTITLYTSGHLQISWNIFAKQSADFMSFSISFIALSSWPWICVNIEVQIQYWIWKCGIN